MLEDYFDHGEYAFDSGSDDDESDMGYTYKSDSEV